jgi:HEPN domain-containing protein
MRRNDSTYPADWLRLAERDLARVEPLVKAADPALAGFCLQQAVEKFLKAFLLVHGWHLRRTHSLELLLEEAVDYDRSLEPYREACQRITAFYLVERYPLLLDQGVTNKDVQDSLGEVAGLVQRIRTAVGPASR